RAKDGNSRYVIRAYTPISDPSEKGVVRLLVKVYFPGNGYATGGKMTTLLNSLEEGHLIDFKGPLGDFQYLGKGKVRFHGMERCVEGFAMVAAGTGITPI